ncbi:MAG: hypothetical protein WAM85_18740 [Terracidiphilus sp.]
MREKDELDDLLDAALGTYADPGPDSDLDQRILARIAAQKLAEPAPRRHWLPWVIALPAAACLLLLVFSGPKTAHPPSGPATKAAVRPSQSPVITAHSEPHPVAHVEPVRGSQRPFHAAVYRPVVLAAKSAPLPKLDVFPTPQPLSPEERALVMFAARAPERERQSLIEAQKQSDEPLRIEAINIPPLDPPTQGAN